MKPLTRLRSISRNLCSRRHASTDAHTHIMQQIGAENARGRGGQRGRTGRPWRGRGARGDGNWRRNGPGEQNDSNSAQQPWRRNDPKPRLTHFVSIPLGHLPAVQVATDSFRSALLEQNPPIAGLDPSIIVTPRRLHLTLGVMSLEEEISAAQYYSQEGTPNLKTVSSALALLCSLHPRITSVLGGNPLRVALTSIDIMKPERNDDSRAHVLFTGPSEEDLNSADGQRLKGVCDLINSEFTKAGFIVDEKRPLKLHCTLINTSHRQPREKGRYGRRTPFSFAEIRDCPAVRALAPVTRAEETVQVIESNETITSTSVTRRSETTTVGSRTATNTKMANRAIPVNFGTHAVSEIQICKMGSWGPEGEYVCVGKIDL